MQPVDPFPDPVHAGQEIEFVGLMFGAIIFIIFLMYLMLYCYFKFRKVLPAITILGFSFLIGMSFLIGNYIALTPYIPMFFIVFQAVMFLMIVLHLDEDIKE